MLQVRRSRNEAFWFSHCMVFRSKEKIKFMSLQETTLPDI
jgi:hypothetical protein